MFLLNSDKNLKLHITEDLTSVDRVNASDVIKIRFFNHSSETPFESMIAWGAYKERTFQSSGEIHNQLSFRFRPGLVLFSDFPSCVVFNFNIVYH